MGIRRSIFFGLALFGFISIFLFLQLVIPIRTSVAAQGGLPGTGDLDFNPASDSENNHCIVPLTDPLGHILCGSSALKAVGCDLNAFYGVSEHLVGGPCGRTIKAGEFYITNFRWFTNVCFEDNDGDDATCGVGPYYNPPPNPLYPGPGYFPVEYPQGYTPDHLQPMDDFLSKIVSVKYLVDGRKAYVFPAEDVMKVVYGTAVIPEEIPAAGVIARLHPLPIGVHTIDIFLILKKKHCDGYNRLLDTNNDGSPDDSYLCLEAGENFFTRIVIEVVDRS